jgi:methyl-accepting chemotaxis protein
MSLTHRSSALIVLIASVVAAMAIAACGGSSKPSYCSSLNNLKTSVQDLKNVKVVQNGTSALKSALQKVETNANDVVNAAKSEFSSQTAAVGSSVDALKKTVGQLTSNPSAISQVPSEVSAVASSVETLVNDASSKCK